MTPEQAQALIAAGETLNVEFKGERVRPLTDAELIEAVVCLANRPGEGPGWLLVGVEDDGQVTGARPRHGNRTDPLRLAALVANRTRPSVAARVSALSLGGADVIVVEVPCVRSPVSTADGRYVRRGVGGDGRPSCLPFHFHEMQSLQATRGLLDYSANVAPEAGWGDLDPLEFERFRRRIWESQGRGDTALQELPDIELAKALGAVEANGDARAVRVLGLLLFGREEALRRHLPSHEAAFQVLSGTEVKVNDFFRWPLVRLMDEIESRFRARNQETELMAGVVRVGVPDYPERAFREAVANALIHRDYARLGAVHVQWHADRIEVSNPGGLPEGVRLDNLLVTSPRPRNPLLADAFKRAGIVERTGRGIDTIFHEHLRTGHAAPTYERSTDAGVVLVLPGGKPDLRFARLVAEEARDDRPLGLEELLILNRLHLNRQLDLAEAAALIQKSETDAVRVLEKLSGTGLIRPAGTQRQRLYLLSPAVRRRLGQTPAHVGKRDSALAEYARSVLRHVKSHGKITRREAAELCGITSFQAKRLLRHLADQGRLTARGQRRGAYYERGPYFMGAPITNMGAPKTLNSRSKRRERT